MKNKKITGGAKKKREGASKDSFDITKLTPAQAWEIFKKEALARPIKKGGSTRWKRDDLYDRWEEHHK